MEDSSKADFKKPVMIMDVKAAQYDAFMKGLDDLLNPSADWSKFLFQLTTNSQKSLLGHHAQMQDNPHRGRTPKALFFVWDFVQRTSGNLSQITVEKLVMNDEDAIEKYSDCVGRAIMAEMIITEKTPTATMMRGGELDFGYEIRKAAKAAAIAGGGEEGERHV